jgi:hypothetical protein
MAVPRPPHKGLGVAHHHSAMANQEKLQRPAAGVQSDQGAGDLPDRAAVGVLAFAMILGLMLVFALTGVGIILMPLFLLVAIIVAGFGGITAGYLLGKIALENISGFAPDQRSDQLKAAGLATALLFIFSLVPFLNYLAFLSLACLGTGLTIWPKIKRMLKLAP